MLKVMRTNDTLGTNPSGRVHNRVRMAVQSDYVLDISEERWGNRLERGGRALYPQID